MNWATIAQLIIQIGLPAAQKIWEKWQVKGEPTAEDWAELRLLANRTPESLLMQALINNNIDLNSEKAKELLRLVGAPVIP